MLVYRIGKDGLCSGVDYELVVVVVVVVVVLYCVDC